MKRVGGAQMMDAQFSILNHSSQNRWAFRKVLTLDDVIDHNYITVCCYFYLSVSRYLLLR